MALCYVSSSSIVFLPSSLKMDSHQASQIILGPDYALGCFEMTDCVVELTFIAIEKGELYFRHGLQ